jgi:hypothetical protein
VRALTGRRGHDLDAPTRARCSMQQAARPERLVVGVGAHDDDAAV